MTALVCSEVSFDEAEEVCSTMRTALMKQIPIFLLARKIMLIVGEAAPANHPDLLRQLVCQRKRVSTFACATISLAETLMSQDLICAVDLLAQVPEDPTDIFSASLKLSKPTLIRSPLMACRWPI